MSVHDDDTRARLALPFLESRVQLVSLASQLLGSGRRERLWDQFDVDEPERVSTLSFFLKYLKNPGTVGAIAPSGQNLAALITSEIGPHTGPVLELGAGGGIFTAALLEGGVSPRDVVAIELDEAFANRLTRRFPKIEVVNAPAERALRYRDLGHAEFGAAISGLPLLNFPWRTRQRLLRLIFQRLKPGGAFYQFTYGLGLPVPRAMLRSLDLEAHFMGRVFRNIPPAAVYRITRR
jgi:phosphatidylethanolamine/phosphatidyl-N-methylethanolamine N-methyltransferase